MEILEEMFETDQENSSVEKTAQSLHTDEPEQGQEIDITVYITIITNLSSDECEHNNGAHFTLI